MSQSSRHVGMLHMLLQSNGSIDLSSVADGLGVSRRTIYYDVKKVDAWLSSQGLGRVSISNGRLLGERVKWGEIESSRLRADDYRYSASERRAMMALYTALSGESMTISKFMDCFGTSRNTVISDIRSIKEEADRGALRFASIPGHGYTIQGEEGAIRKYIWNELRSLDGSECVTAIRDFLQSTLTSMTGNDIDYFELCRCLIKQYESDLRTTCFLEGNGFESTMIQVSWLRSLNGHWIEMGRDERMTLMGTVSYRSVQCSAEKLKKNGIILPGEELFYITSLLLGIKTVDFAERREEDQYVSTLAERLVSNFERIGCLSFVDKGIICMQMSQHIRPLYYRLKYGLPARNPLMADIKKTYPMAFEFTRRAAAETDLGELSDDEIAYLTIYLTAGLDRKMFEDGDTSSTEVLIVGASDMSTATLVKKQVSDACGMSFEYSCTGLPDLHRWELDRYALVLTLTALPLSMRTDNMVEVSPFLTEENRERIYEVLRSNRIISRYNSAIDQVVGIVARNVPSFDLSSVESSKLRFELFRYFSERDNGPLDGVPATADGTHASGRHVRVGGGATWQDMVFAGCAAIQEETGSKQLVSRMRNLVQSPKFQYYRVSGHVVLVHCPMQGDERGRVLAQVVLSGAGAEFPDGKDTKVVICMVTIDRYSHWGALYSIYRRLSESECIDGLEAELAESVTR